MPKFDSKTDLAVVYSFQYFSGKQTLTTSWHRYNSLAYTFAARSGDMKALKKHGANATNETTCSTYIFIFSFASISSCVYLST